MRKESALAVALLLCGVLAAPAMADDPNVPTGTVSVGYGISTGKDESSKLQQFSVVPDRQASLGMDLAWNMKNDLFLTLSGDKLYLDDMGYDLVVGKHGGWKAFLYFDQNPRWFSNTASTLFLERERSRGYFETWGDMRSFLGSSTRARLDGTCAPGTTPACTPNATNFAARALPVDLRAMRRTTTLGFEMPFGESIIFSLVGRNEDRDGRYPQPVGQGSPGNGRVWELPAPMRWTTRDITFTSELIRKNVQVSAQVWASQFNNKIDALVFENPSTAVASAGNSAINRISVAPDSRAWNADLQFSARLPKKHKLIAQYGYGQAIQDDKLLPYTANTFYTSQVGFNNVPPVYSIDGRVDNTLMLLKLLGDPGRVFGYSVSFRSFETENKTPHYTFASVIQGDNTAAQVHESEGLGYKKDTLKGEVHLNASKVVRFGLQYARDMYTHEGGPVHENTTSTFTGSVDVRMGKGVNLRASLSDQKNDVDKIGHVILNESDANYVVDRESTIYDVVLNITPIDTLSFGVSASKNESKYPKTSFGTIGSNYRNYGMDMSWMPSEKLSFWLFYLNERFDWNTAHRYRTPSPPTEAQNPANNWFTRTNDKYDTYGVGGKFKGLLKNFDLSVDYNFSNGTSDNFCAAAAGGLSQGNCGQASPDGTFKTYYPQVATKFHWLKAKGYYTFNANVGGGIEIRRDRFDGKDWAVDPMAVYMGSYDILANSGQSTWLGATVPNYNATSYYVFVDYKF